MLLNQGVDSPVVEIISLLILVWLLFLSFLLLKAVSHYRRLTSKVKKKDLKTVLNKILSQIEQQVGEIKTLQSETQSLKKSAQEHLQKVGFVRFNPFSDTGGDQSFCLSLLDDKDNGVVLSSLHSRGQTRVYAKAVEKGKGKDFPLSKEEEETIKKAKKGK